VARGKAAGAGEEGTSGGRGDVPGGTPHPKRLTCAGRILQLGIIPVLVCLPSVCCPFPGARESRGNMSETQEYFATAQASLAGAESELTHRWFTTEAPPQRTARR
jgi:hypothetical protein